jgi:hypothetical protein
MNHQKRVAAELPYVPSSKDYLLRKAQMLRKQFPHLGRNKSNETAARVFGFDSLNAAYLAIAKHRNPGCTDDLLTPVTRAARAAYQKAVLCSEGLSPDAVDRFLPQWNPTGASRGGPQANTRIRRRDVEAFIALSKQFDGNPGSWTQEEHEAFKLFMEGGRHRELDAELDKRAWHDLALAQVRAKWNEMQLGLNSYLPEEEAHADVRVAVYVLESASFFNVGVPLGTAARTAIHRELTQMLPRFDVRLGGTVLCLLPAQPGLLPTALIAQTLHSPTAIPDENALLARLLGARLYLMVGATLVPPAEEPGLDIVQGATLLSSLSTPLVSGKLSFEAARPLGIFRPLEALALAELGPSVFHQLHGLLYTEAGQPGGSVELVRTAQIAHPSGAVQSFITFNFETTRERLEVMAAGHGSRTLDYALAFAGEVPVKVAIRASSIDMVQAQPGSKRCIAAMVEALNNEECSSAEIDRCWQQLSDTGWGAEVKLGFYEALASQPDTIPKYCAFLRSRWERCGPMLPGSKKSTVYGLVFSGRANGLHTAEFDEPYARRLESALLSRLAADRSDVSIRVSRRAMLGLADVEPPLLELDVFDAKAGLDAAYWSGGRSAELPRGGEKLAGYVCFFFSVDAPDAVQRRVPAMSFEFEPPSALMPSFDAENPQIHKAFRAVDHATMMGNGLVDYDIYEHLGAGSRVFLACEPSDTGRYGVWTVRVSFPLPDGQNWENFFETGCPPLLMNSLANNLMEEIPGLEVIFAKW